MNPTTDGNNNATIVIITDKCGEYIELIDPQRTSWM